MRRAPRTQWRRGTPLCATVPRCRPCTVGKKLQIFFDRPVLSPADTNRRCAQPPQIRTILRPLATPTSCGKLRTTLPRSATPGSDTIKGGPRSRPPAGRGIKSKIETEASSRTQCYLKALRYTTIHQGPDSAVAVIPVGKDGLPCNTFNVL